MPTGPSGKWAEVGDNLLLYLSPLDATLGLVYRDWFKHTVSDPASVPIPNPYLDCPGLYLRPYTDELGAIPLQSGTQAEDKYLYSFWYYKRQTPGAKNPRLLIADLMTIRNRFTQAFLDKNMIPATPGYNIIKAYPANVNVHSDIRHKWDDPKLRVSVGELQIEIEGRISTCGE